VAWIHSSPTGSAPWSSWLYGERWWLQLGRRTTARLGGSGLVFCRRATAMRVQADAGLMREGVGSASLEGARWRARCGVIGVLSPCAFAGCLSPAIAPMLGVHVAAGDSGRQASSVCCMRCFAGVAAVTAHGCARSASCCIGVMCSVGVSEAAQGKSLGRHDGDTLGCRNLSWKHRRRCLLLTL
jgi:hypothetical protein